MTEICGELFKKKSSAWTDVPLHNGLQHLTLQHYLIMLPRVWFDCSQYCKSSICSLAGVLGLDLQSAGEAPLTSHIWRAQWLIHQLCLIVKDFIRTVHSASCIMLHITLHSPLSASSASMQTSHTPPPLLPFDCLWACLQPPSSNLSTVRKWADHYLCTDF